MAAYGYARVSSKDQNVRRQLDALQAFPLSKRNIYIDHWTGATFDRPQYRALMRRLRAGDVLVVTSIDRLGRSYAEILDQWRYLTRTRRAAIVVLDMPLLDTRVTPSNLTGAFVADIVLQLLSYVAQIERENIRHTWRRLSARTSATGRPRALQRRGRAASTWGAPAYAARPTGRRCASAFATRSSRATRRPVSWALRATRCSSGLGKTACNRPSGRRRKQGPRAPEQRRQQRRRAEVRHPEQRPNQRKCTRKHPNRRMKMQKPGMNGQACVISRAIS